MVTYLGKFMSTLPDDTVRMRSLLKLKDNDWYWTTEMTEEFDRLKQKISSFPVLAPFDLNAETWLSTDASSYGLGAAIFQKTAKGFKPIALASRALTDTEKRYAQIEKEALAMCWAAKKFYYYLAGRSFKIETDHKPLVSIMAEKELFKLPIRLQRFRLRMMRFSNDVTYVPGEKLVVADALSRAPSGSKKGSDPEPLLIQEMIEELPISHYRRRRLELALASDPIASQLMTFIQAGWPTYQKLPQYLKKYNSFKEELTVIGGLLFYYNRLYIPLSERERVLNDIHRGHLGENRCLRRAQRVVWWPGMSLDVREMVRRCEICLRFRKVPVEPLIPTPLPERPWWKLAMDFCSIDGNGVSEFLVICDYYSRFMIAEKFSTVTAAELCRVVNKIICTMGVPNTIISDNGPQFISDSFAKLMKKWDIVHQTSSPRNPQANGQAERGVQTFKKLGLRMLISTSLLCATLTARYKMGIHRLNCLWVVA